MLLTEGVVKIDIPKEEKLTSKNKVFYNPVQVVNRDISILLLQAIYSQRQTTNLLNSEHKRPTVLDLLSASGIRAIRIKKEVPDVDVFANDFNPYAYEAIKKNAELNKLRITVTKKHADQLLSEHKMYNYIDIDPFGTPIPFLDAAVKCLHNHGILAVTATDTAVLCGTYPKTCLRLYQSRPLRNYLMHEVGIRILIKKVQAVAAQYDVALTPIFSHSTQHYMRVYFRAERGAERADNIIKLFQYITYCPHHRLQMYGMPPLYCEDCMGKNRRTENDIAGPMWLGQLWDKQLVEQMFSLATNTTAFRKLGVDTYLQALKQPNISAATIDLLRLIYFESKVDIPFFYDIHELAKSLKLKSIPRMSTILKSLRARGHSAERTHFKLTGIRTDADYDAMIQSIKSQYN